jgi:PAS domain S-box-containing protein
MGPSAYTLLGLTAIVAVFVGVLAFAVAKFVVSARTVRRQIAGGDERALMSGAFEEAIARLRAQERAMSARAEASERLNTEIVASLTAGLLVVGLDGQVRIMNPAGQRLLGLGGEQGTRPFRDLLVRHTPIVEALEECLKTGAAIVRRAVKVTSSDQGTVYLGLTVSPLSDVAGQRHGAICLFTDLTAVIELEEQVRLKDSLARLGELTAGLAHEFRNGLATVHGYARLLDLNVLPPAQRPYLEGLRSGTEALGEIVTNFLSFARPAQFEPSRVELGAVVERAAEEFRGDARSRGGDVVVRGEFAAVEGDEVLLRQVFSNLVRNAMEAIASTGRPPLITVEGQIEAGFARVAVDDNGPGIEPAQQPSVFKPFFTTKSEGTGLGLALVQKIVVMHNGRVTAGTAPGGGARFQVTLPVAGEEGVGSGVEGV